MQPIAISNVPAANIPSGASAASLPFGPQRVSIFAAIFHDLLKGVASGPKLPPPGQPQDSNRDPFSTAGKLQGESVPMAPISVPLTFAPIPISPNLSATNEPAPAVRAVTTGSTEPTPSSQPDPFASGGVSGLPTDVIPSTAASSAAVGSPVPLAAPALLSSGFASPSLPLPDDPGNSSPPSEIPQGANRYKPVEAQSLAARQGFNSTPAVPEGASSISLTALELEAAANYAGDFPQGSGVQSASSVPSTVTTALPQATAQSNGVAPEASPSPYQGQAASSVPGNMTIAAGNFFPILQAMQNGSANGANPQSPESANTCRTDQILPGIDSSLKAVTAWKISISGVPNNAVRPGTQLPTQAPLGTSQAQSKGGPLFVETLTSPAARSGAAFVPTLKLHDNLAPPPTNPSSPAPVAAAPAKPLTQDHPNGSSGNNSNSKSDHASPGSMEKAPDDRNFTQTLDPGTSPANGRSSPMTLTAPPSPILTQAPSTNPDLQPARTNGADLPSTPAFQTNPHDAPIVNAAHILAQPGQTEIRIEMQADSLGGVELRARIAGDQIGASIAVEHHYVQQALATELPALQSALAEKNLRVETLSVTQGTLSTLNGGHGHGQDTGQRSQTNYPERIPYAERSEPVLMFSENPVESVIQANSTRGLSVVA